jgi:tetratricopeptide (TPR) repeat protein
VAALASYDSVLVDVRDHRDAMLGRLLALSYLNRHTEAIATATRMIELGTWHVGDAYYWRAWNRYHIYALESAWADVEQATTLQHTTSVFALGGFIAFARKELDTAIDRFDRAFALDATNCEAVWTAGLVHVEQQRWVLAAPKFSTAMSCFTGAAEEARGEIERTRLSDSADGVKTRRIGAAEKRIQTAAHRRAQSAYNAASCFLRLGQRGAAVSHLDVAATHPLLKDKAAALRPALEKIP